MCTPHTSPTAQANFAHQTGVSSSRPASPKNAALWGTSCLPGLAHTLSHLALRLTKHLPWPLLRGLGCAHARIVVHLSLHTMAPTQGTAPVSGLICERRGGCCHPGLSLLHPKASLVTPKPLPILFPYTGSRLSLLSSPNPSGPAPQCPLQFSIHPAHSDRWCCPPAT